MQGYIKLHRQLLDNPLFTSEPFTRGQAWITLLLLTNYKDGYIAVKNGELLKIERGECGYSELALAKIFKWSRGKVKRFINLLESEKMIQQKIRSNRLIIKVLNYENFQNDTTNSTTNGQQTIQQTVQQTDINNNDKNDKNIVNTVVVVEEEKLQQLLQENQKIYGEFQNVCLTDENYQKLLGICMSEKLLNELIEQLSEKIGTGEENPYNAACPDAHYIRLRSYYKYRLKNPDKFKEQEQTSREAFNEFYEKEKARLAAKGIY